MSRRYCLCAKFGMDVGDIYGLYTASPKPRKPNHCAVCHKPLSPAFIEATRAPYPLGPYLTDNSEEPYPQNYCHAPLSTGAFEHWAEKLMLGAAVCIGALTIGVLLAVILPTT